MEEKELNGFCLCIHCNITVEHVKGNPCRETNCPNCGKKMMRQDGYHHQLYLSKKGESNYESSNSNKGNCC